MTQSRRLFKEDADQINKEAVKPILVRYKTRYNCQMGGIKSCSRPSWQKKTEQESKSDDVFDGYGRDVDERTRHVFKESDYK